MILAAEIDGFSLHGGANGVGLQGLELGTPEPRAQYVARPAQHGAVDRTVYYGPRLIEIRGVVVASSQAELWQAVDDLKAAMSIGAQRVLTFTRGDGEVMRCIVRHDGPVVVQPNAGNTAPMLPWAAVLIAPDPRLYSDTESTGSYDPTDSGTGGLTFDLAFDLDFDSSGTAALLVSNDGNIATPPTFTITGPVVNPIIDNDTTGDSITTTGLELSAGEAVEIDVAGRRCLLAGTTNRPDLIDASRTSWFDLDPGTTQLRLRGSGMSATLTELEVSFRSARI